MNRRSSSSIEKDLGAIVPNDEAMQVSAGAEEAIRERLLRSLEPVRPLPSRAVLAAAFLAIFAVVTAILVAFVGVRGAAVMTATQLGGILAAILVAAGLAALSLSNDMSPGHRRLVNPKIMTGGVLVGLFILVGGLFPWNDGLLHGWHCFSSGFLFSLPAVALVLLVIRRGVPLAWGAVGASAGLLGGLVGLATVHVGCSIVNAPHMLVGHITIPLAAALGGYIAGKTLPRLIAPRAF